MIITTTFAPSSLLYLLRFIFLEKNPSLPLLADKKEDFNLGRDIPPKRLLLRLVSVLDVSDSSSLGFIGSSFDSFTCNSSV